MVTIDIGHNQTFQGIGQTCQDCAVYAKNYCNGVSIYQKLLTGLGLVACIILFIKQPAYRVIYAVLATIFAVLLIVEVLQL